MAQAKQDGAKVPVKFRRVKQITRPVLKLMPENPVYVKITAEIHTGNSAAKAGSDGQQMKPAQIANIINLETGEEMQLIFPAVLERIMLDQYPGGEYVGQSFEIVKHAPRDGKRYSTFDVCEVAPD
jgi:hypothetical protein